MRVLVLSALLVGSVSVAHAASDRAGRADQFRFHLDRAAADHATAGGREAFTSEDMLVVTASSPGSVLDKLAGRCLQFGEQATDGSLFTQRGTCTFTDVDGDHIFEAVDVQQRHRPRLSSSAARGSSRASPASLSSPPRCSDRRPRACGRAWGTRRGATRSSSSGQGVAVVIGATMLGVGSPARGAASPGPTRCGRCHRCVGPTGQRSRSRSSPRSHCPGRCTGSSGGSPAATSCCCPCSRCW